MPIYEALASWWVGAAVMASFVIFTPEGVSFMLIYIACSQHIDARFVISGGLPGGNRVTLNNQLRGLHADTSEPEPDAAADRDCESMWGLTEPADQTKPQALAPEEHRMASSH